VPGIHVFKRQFVDGRGNPGHDSMKFVQ
jgi:hypothetical protein